MLDKISERSAKLYSQRSIWVATYLGGPLAAGILIRRNFVNLGKEQKGKIALFIGVIATLLLFVGIFSIPEHIIDKVPNFLIPAIYTMIVHLIVQQTQGQDLKQHELNKGEFYSGWKAAGIGIFGLVIILASVFGYSLFAPQDFDTVRYDEGIVHFNRNEERALELYKILETGNIERSSSYISTIGISSWEKNLKLLDELDSIEGLPQEYMDQNQILREYCKLRIESYQLMRKALKEDTDIYDEDIRGLTDRINSLIEKL